MDYGMLIGGIGAGLGAVGSVYETERNIHANKQLQERDLEFQRNEAKLGRDFQAQQNEINRDWQTNANQVAMDFSAREAQANRNWQQMMSSTAHQREMADLRKAGLNPILAASDGADMGSGATASGVANSPVMVGSTSTARGSSQHIGRGSNPFKAITDFVGDYLHSAYRVSAMADEYEYKQRLQDRRQALDLMNDKESYSYKVSYSKSKPNADVANWFDQLMKKY